MMTKKTGLALVILLLVVMAAQTIHAGAGEQSGTTTATPPVPSFTGLQTALNLTDAQVSQLQTLVQSQNAGLQTLLTNLRTAQQALQMALKGTDTAAIGTANLAVQTAQTALTNAQKANHQALLAVLTTSQQQIISDYLLIAANGGLGPFGTGMGGPGMRGPGGGPGGYPQLRGGARP